MITRIVFLSLFLAAAASAQSTIFNVPSTDVQPHGSVAIEGDFITKPVAIRNGGYQTYGYREVWGTGDKTEVGANFFYTYDGGSAAQVQFDAKRRIYFDEKRGFAISAGVLATVPLRSGPDVKPDVMIYAVASKTIAGLGGTRVTGGGYGIITRSPDSGSKAGAIIGIEQPVYKKVSFLADWYSGQNKIGYSAAGFDLSLTKKQYLVSGWNFGNSGRGNNGLAVFYGYVF